VPAFEGCTAQGVTMEQVKENIKVAVHDWFEDMEAKYHVNAAELSDICMDGNLSCNLKVHAKVSKGDDGLYLAEVSALKDCTAQGVSKIEALCNLKVALAQWIQLSELRSGIDLHDLVNVEF
jgi:predicted RNase H-like HicB family nuclease